MLFNSIEFVFFFPLVVVLYFTMPQRYRWAMLLAASYYFYGSWKAEYLVLLMISTLIDYWAALRMGQVETRAERKPYLVASMIGNLGMLFAFKYLNFFNESARALFDRFDIFYNVPEFQFLLPVGISFYTFQSMSYTIDVYRGDLKPERHLGIFALYVSFFPQLVAGPIERSPALLPQFRQHHRFNYDRAVSGMRRVLWGFFKKLVVADLLAQYVNAVYNSPSEATGLQMYVASVFFAFQIYCDFSGYSDIAIGTSRLLGYDLMENFRQPYLAKSISDFWRRWHISLSTWFKDYVYFPLGGNRVVRWRWYYNLLVVFLVSGLWHGAAWTFVIWGALHGIFQIASIATKGFRDRTWESLENLFRAPARQYAASGFPLTLKLGTVRSVLATVITFHLVLLGWVFFRANSMPDAMLILGGIFDPASYSGSVLVPGFGAYHFFVAIAALLALEAMHHLQERDLVRPLLQRMPRWGRWGLYWAIGITIVLFGTFGHQEFIYFQF